MMRQPPPPLIEPERQHTELLADIAAHGQPGDPRLHLWWLGQSGFLLKHDGRVFLFDPYLSDSLTEKYAATDKPHIRMTARCIEPALLPRPEFVTASHIHTDHLDAATLRPLALSHPGLRLVLPWPILDEARARLGDAPVEFLPLDAGQHLAGDGWQLHALPAAHNDLKTDAEGRHHYLGFLLRAGPFTVYHSGDTLWHAGLVPALLPGSQAEAQNSRLEPSAAPLLDQPCDVMLLPINGHQPARRVAGNLNGTEAAALARACRARLVIPCHYDMFTFNTEPPGEFAAACARLGQPFEIMRCGGRVSVSRTPSPPAMSSNISSQIHAAIEDKPTNQPHSSSSASIDKTASPRMRREPTSRTGWWLAGLLERHSFTDRPPYWNNYRLVRADDWRSAFRKASEMGERNVITGNAAFSDHQEFLGVTDLVPLYESLEDGAELLWEELNFSEEGQNEPPLQVYSEADFEELFEKD